LSKSITDITTLQREALYHAYKSPQSFSPWAMPRTPLGKLTIRSPVGWEGEPHTIPSS